MVGRTWEGWQRIDGRAWHFNPWDKDLGILWKAKVAYLPMQPGHVEGERGMDGWMNPYEPRGTAYGTNKRRGRRGRRTRQYPVATPGLFVPRSHRITFLQ